MLTDIKKFLASDAWISRWVSFAWQASISPKERKAQWSKDRERGKNNFKLLGCPAFENAFLGHTQKLQ